MLDRYDDFIAFVDHHGFLPMSRGFLEGFPSLSGLTTGQQWHTANPDTDPWQWKDRAAAEHRLAFGCLLGGHKGFINRELYPYYYAACRPRMDLEERFSLGTVKRLTMEVYGLFDINAVLSTADIRALINSETKRATPSKLDRICLELQRDFYITVCGNKRKVSAAGQEYGWPSNAYSRVEDWAGGWLDDVDEITPQEGRARILDAAQSICPAVDVQALTEILFAK